MAGAENDLALQIVDRDRIRIDQADRSDTGSGQIKGCRCAKAPCANYGDMRTGQGLLAGTANFLEHKVAGEAVDIDFGCHVP